MFYRFAIKNCRIHNTAVWWRRHPDLNWGIRVLQTRALPLGYGAEYRAALIIIPTYTAFVKVQEGNINAFMGKSEG